MTPQQLLQALIASVMLVFVMAKAQAAQIIDTEFNSLPDNKVEMTFTFDGEVPKPAVYAIENPARIALDFAGTTSGLKKKKFPLDMHNVQSAVVVTSGDRTRVVINLLSLGTYETRVEGNKLHLDVGNGQQSFVAKAKSAIGKARESKQLRYDEAAIKTIDFRRGDNGEGRLVIELTTPYVDVDNRLEGKDIRLHFGKTALPKDLQLRYDVSDFATPIKWIDAKQANQAAHLIVRPSGDYDYLAYQSGSTYVLTVKPLTQEEIEAKEKEFSFVGDKLSLNFQDIEVRSVLQLIADFTDLNLVASDTVTGKITLRLQNVPWDQALDLILKTKGLDKRQEGNVLLVAPAVEIAQREQQEIQTNKQLEELAPLQTEFIRVRYADARNIGDMLMGKNEGSSSGSEDGGEEDNRLLTERAMVVVDERTNSLLLTETANKMVQIRKLIELIDVPVKQVMIEARVVVATSEASEALGIKWGGTNGRTDDEGRTFMAAGSDQSLLEFSKGEEIPFGNVVDLSVTDIGATKINLGLLSDNGLLNLELSAIESSGNGEVLSQPKIITGDKQNAVIKAGQQIPYEATAPNGGTTVKFIDAALVLDVTPNITPDNRVIMKLKINQDSIGPETSGGVPTIDTNQLETEVLVNNGETVVLGGVFSSAELQTVTKTPFLGDIPYLGRLFRKNTVSSEKTELLVFVTPKILTESLVE